MSRVGKYPIAIPDGVAVDIDGQAVTVKGKLGELSHTLTDDVDISAADGLVTVKPRNNGKRARSMWGTSRSVINNMFVGVSEGFKTELEIVGVGYRAAVEGKSLNLQLGFSHDVQYAMPEGITIACERPTHIAVSGIDRQRVGQVAAEIRAFRKPEPYKGKGVRYANEWVRRKEGKKK
ncbi:MAG: 50S ribosomal protein L6 [Alphaproteobacteria bacterium]